MESRGILDIAAKLGIKSNVDYNELDYKKLPIIFKIRISRKKSYIVKNILVDESIGIKAVVPFHGKSIHPNFPIYPTITVEKDKSKFSIFYEKTANGWKVPKLSRVLIKPVYELFFFRPVYEITDDHKIVAKGFRSPFEIISYIDSLPDGKYIVNIRENGFKIYEFVNMVSFHIKPVFEGEKFFLIKMKNLDLPGEEEQILSILPHSTNIAFKGKMQKIFVFSRHGYVIKSSSEIYINGNEIEAGEYMVIVE